MIADLFDYAGISFGKMHLCGRDHRPVPALVVALDAVEAAARALTGHASSCGRPSTPNRSAVDGDPARLQQIVWNLLTNAIKFSSRGRRGNVSCQARDRAIVSIWWCSDLAKASIRYSCRAIFERFSQQDATSPRQSTAASGLGNGNRQASGRIAWRDQSGRSSDGNGQGRQLHHRSAAQRQGAQLRPRREHAVDLRTRGFVAESSPSMVEDDADAPGQSTRRILDAMRA